MNQDTTLQQEASVREAVSEGASFSGCLTLRTGREVLTFLEARFQTDLPVFQGSRGVMTPWTP